MNTTKEQQKELDDALVAPKNRLKIGKSNLRLSSNLKSKEPTLQVVLDALKLTPFYNAFEISADVPEIYIQEFWVTVTRHHSSLQFKLNCKKDLGHTGEIKFYLMSIVNHMHQPWRSFAAIINKCLSGKTTALWKAFASRTQGKSDGVDILSKVPDEQQQTESGTNEGAGEDEEEDEENDSDDDNDDEDDVQEHDNQKTESDDSGDDFVHPNLSTYKADEEEQEKEEEKAKDDDEVIFDQKVSPPPYYELTEEDENQQDDDTMGGEQEDEKDEELVSSLEIELSELKQTNQFAAAVASIPGIVDNYLTSKMKDEVNMALQLKSDKLREEAQAENQLSQLHLTQHEQNNQGTVKSNNLQDYDKKLRK
ncbi:hypothetical protein Tco_0357461 [Tanacetum coccineum]